MPAPTKAERQELKRLGDALVEVLKATPTGSQGEGYWMMDSRNVGQAEPSIVPPGVALARYPLWYQSSQFPFYHADHLNKDGTWRKSVAGETESIGFTFNRLPEPRTTLIITEPPVGDRQPVQMFTRPRAIAHLGGLPIYENGVLVIARAGRDPWATVEVGRALGAALPQYEKDKQTAEDRLAGYKKKEAETQSAAWEQQQRGHFDKNYGSLQNSDPTKYQNKLAGHEKYVQGLREQATKEANPQRDDKGMWYWNPIDALERAKKALAEITPAEAAKPACFIKAKDGRESDGRYAMTGDIVAVGSVAAESCSEIVIMNHQYFDTTLPRTAPQLLTMSDFNRCTVTKDDRVQLPEMRRFDAPPQGCYRHARIWSEADWAKIAALVRP